MGSAAKDSLAFWRGFLGVQRSFRSWICALERDSDAKVRKIILVSSISPMRLKSLAGKFKDFAKELRALP